MKTNRKSDNIDLNLVQAMDGKFLESGDTYIGNLIFDKPHGPGKILYSDYDSYGRTYYKGEFGDGYRHGIGTMAWQDGTIYQGEWKYGQPDGFGVECYPNGTKYLGQFSSDLRNGLGKYISEGSIIWSKWKDGHRSGVSVVETDDGEIKYIEYDDRGYQKTEHDLVSIDVSNSTAVQHITANADAVENFAIQIQGRVIREWKSLDFIDNVMVPIVPSSPGSELEKTRKGLRPRFPTDIRDHEQESSQRFSAGNAGDFNLEKNPIEDVDRSLNGSRDSRPVDAAAKLRLAVETMKESQHGHYLRDSECTDNSRSELEVGVNDLRAEDVLTSTKQAFLLYERQSLRFTSLLNQLVIDLEQIQKSEKDSSPRVRDLIQRVNQLAQNALYQQDRTLLQCRQILDKDNSYAESDLELVGASRRPEFQSHLYELNEWLDDLHHLSSRLPAYILEFSNYFECVVEDVLNKAAEVVVGLENDEFEALLDFREEGTNAPMSSVTDMTREDHDNSVVVTNHIAEDVILNIYNALENLAARMMLMVQQIDQNTCQQTDIGEPGTKGVPLPSELVQLKNELQLIFKTLEAKMASIDLRMDSVQQSQSDMRKAHVEMQYQLTRFLTTELPTLLEAQTASIKQQLLSHLDRPGSQSGRPTSAVPNSIDKITQLPVQGKEDDTSESLDMQETMLLVETVLQQTVEQVAKNIAILIHPEKNQSKFKTSDDFEKRNAQSICGAGVNCCAMEGNTLATAHTPVPPIPSNTEDQKHSLGDHADLPEHEGSLDRNRTELPGPMMIDDEFVLRVKELVGDGEKLLDLLSESTYLSLFNSGFLCSKGRVASVLRKYMLVVNSESLANGCGKALDPFDCHDLEASVSVQNVSHIDRLRRAFSAKSKSSFENLLQDGDILLSSLGPEYLHSILSTLLEWSEKNILASAFCMEFGVNSIHTHQSEQNASVRRVENLVELGYEAYNLISKLGPDHVESLSLAVSEGRRRKSAISVLVSSYPVVEDPAPDGVFSDKQRLKECLEVQSSQTLHSLILDAKDLLSKIDVDGCDVLEMIKATAHTNLVAASIYHEVSLIPEEGDKVAKARNLLMRFIEQGEDLNVILQESGDDDILSLILNQSGARSPLSVILYRYLCTIPQSGPKDPATFRRMLSAKTKRNLDLLLTEGRLLLAKLGNDLGDDLIREIHDEAKGSPLSSLLLYEILMDTVDVNTVPDSNVQSKSVCARYQDSLLDLLGEGRSLLMNLNNDHAEGILRAIFENLSQSPVARILSYEILSSHHSGFADQRAGKRSCSAQSRKYLQELLAEGKILLCALERQKASVILDSICASINQNTISSILYYEIVACWFLSESKFQDLEQYRTDLNHYSQNMLLDLIRECTILLEKLNSNIAYDLVSTLVESREQSPLSRVLLHRILHGLISSSCTRSDSVNAKSRIIIEELLIEGKGLLERIGATHFNSILPLICSNFKKNPLSVVIFNDILKSFISDHQDTFVAQTAHFERNFMAYLDSKFCIRLSELLDEGEALFATLGDVYSNSLLHTIIEGAGKNPIAALLYSDNLLSLRKSLQQSRCLPRPIESIKTALSARSLKLYDDMMSEGEELLGAINPTYANCIVESISEQKSILAMEVVNEIMQFIADDNSLSSDVMQGVSLDMLDGKVGIEGSTLEVQFDVEVLSEDNATEILQRSFRMHRARRAWKKLWEVRSAVVVQCAFRIHRARNVLQFWKKIANFVNYPQVQLISNSVAVDIKQRCNESLHHAPLSPVLFKTKCKRLICMSKPRVLPWFQQNFHEHRNFRNQIQWTRKRNKALSRTRMVEELERAKFESGLSFSNLSLIKCITRHRAKRLDEDQSCECLRWIAGDGLSAPITSLVSRKFKRSCILIQIAIRNHKAREHFARAFVRRENIFVAGLKIFHWIAKCRHLKQFRKERKSRLRCAHLDKSALCIQQMFRQHLARLDYRYQKRLLSHGHQQVLDSTLLTATGAATLLQKVWIGHLGRRGYANSILRKAEQISHHLQHRAAVSIQSAMRMHWAKHLFVVANSEFCNNFLGNAATSIQVNYRCHASRKYVKRLRKSLSVMQQFVTKLAWLKTLGDLIRVSVVEWNHAFQFATSMNAQVKPFAYAQSVAPSVFPSWWLAHFPIPLSCRAEMKADMFHILEEQIRIDRTNSLGGASSFSKTLEMIGLLVNEVTQSHAIALDMSDSYNVSVSLIAFCNIHGTRLMSSVDEMSQQAGNDLLVYADRLADGPCRSLPGLPERTEFHRWTQSNICRMHYLRSDFHKTSQVARLLILSDIGEGRSDSLVSIVGHVYLGIAQSKLGKHVTAAATFQKALELLGKWSSVDAENSWSSFSCTKELERFYACSSAHIAAVCFYNLAIELVACHQLAESVASISRAFILAEKDTQREPIFLRRVKLTKIAIDQLHFMHNTFDSRPEKWQETDLARTARPMIRAQDRVENGTTASSFRRNPEDLLIDPLRSDIGKKRFGSWFPPSVAFRSRISIPKVGSYNLHVSENGGNSQTSLFLKISCAVNSNDFVQQGSPRRLSPLNTSLMPQNDLSTVGIFLAAFPVETKDAFEIISEDSLDLYYAVEYNSVHLVRTLVKEFRKFSRAASGNTMRSSSIHAKMMDMAALCNRVVLRDIVQICDSKDPESAASLKIVEKFSNVAMALVCGPLKDENHVLIGDMRALAHHSKFLTLMVKTEHRQALWVISKMLVGGSLESTCRQRIVFLLNFSSCLSVLGQHKDAFDASYQAWTLLQTLEKSEAWFCYSVQHDQTELTMHHWNSFAALCKYQLGKESLLLGFEGPCLGFAGESKALLERVAGQAEIKLMECIQRLFEAASQRTPCAKRTGSNSFSSFSSVLSPQSLGTVRGKTKAGLKYAWASPTKRSGNETAQFLATSSKNARGQI